MSVFLSFCTFVDVRRLSSIFAMFYCLSQMFVDFRKSAVLHFYISAFLHCYVFSESVYRYLSESVGVNRLESVGVYIVWAGIAKRNKKRRIASDVPRSFSHLLYNSRCCNYISLQHAWGMLPVFICVALYIEPGASHNRCI